MSDNRKRLILINLLEITTLIIAIIITSNFVNEVNRKYTKNTDIKKFDINGDGNIDNKDLEVIRNVIDKKVVYIPSTIERADLNEDGEVTLLDLAIMKSELLERGITNE